MNQGLKLRTAGRSCDWIMAVGDQHFDANRQHATDLESWQWCSCEPAFRERNFRHFISKERRKNLSHRIWLIGENLYVLNFSATTNFFHMANWAKLINRHWVLEQKFKSLFRILIIMIVCFADKWCSRELLAVGILCYSDHLGIFLRSQLSSWCT